MSLEQTKSKMIPGRRRKYLSWELAQPVRIRTAIIRREAPNIRIGMSCAHHLSQHPDKFDVTVIDAVDYCGGQAFSIPIDKGKHKASWLNQGVQGGSYIFHHTMTMFARQGHHADPVKLQVGLRPLGFEGSAKTEDRSPLAKTTRSGPTFSQPSYYSVMPMKSGVSTQCSR
jgi:hypothetical protein